VCQPIGPRSLGNGMELQHGLVVAPGGGNRYGRCSGNRSEAEALIPVLFHLFLSVSQHSAHFGNCAADVTAGGGVFIVS
jgi:hypothetical protein